MKRIFVYTLLVSLVVLINASNQSQNNTYTITATLETVVVPDTDTNGETSEVLESTVGWEEAKVLVTQEVINSAGEFETIELAAGTFEDGELTLSGNVDHPTEVRISVETEGADPLTLDAVIAPEASISFLLIEYPDFNYASMKFFGESRKVLNPANRFSISGDLSPIEADLERATVQATAWEYDKRGEQQTLNFGTVFLDDGKFFIEADVEEPKVVNILVILPASQEHTQFHVIVEPKVGIEIMSNSSWLYDLTPVAGTGKHAQLVESWSQTEEYLSLKQEYRLAYQEYQIQTQKSEDEGDSAAEGTPTHLELRRKMNRIRYDFLEDVASNAEDPMDALLALEMSAYWGKEEALPIYDRLAKTLDKDLVIRRVVNARNSHASNLEKRGIDRSLVVGKNVPEFTLPNIKGEQISLRQLLDRNEFVLVEFWASWCGPCIETIPALKNLHASYNEYGFEIVSISIDDNREAWVEASDEYDLPWVNLGELKDWEGEVATSYGVTGIPKKYLLDNEGQIVQKDPSIDQLKELLTKQYTDVKN